MEHFGLKIFERKYGFRLTKENFAVVNPRCSFPNSLVRQLIRESFKKEFDLEAFTDDTCTFYTDDWCQWNLKNCLENYDLSMKYFSQLDKDEFVSYLNAFLRKNRQFVPITDLSLYKGTSGNYLMVMDEYCQAYVGASGDMAERIRTHWTKQETFDRMLLPHGNVTGSVVPSYSFRALDTTRIYVRKAAEPFSKEDFYIQQMPSKFSANRIQGGKFFEDFMLPMIKTRDLK